MAEIATEACGAVAHSGRPAALLSGGILLALLGFSSGLVGPTYGEDQAKAGHIAPYGEKMTVSTQRAPDDWRQVVRAIRGSSAQATEVSELASLAGLKVVRVPVPHDPKARRAVSRERAAHAAQVSSLQEALKANALVYAALSERGVEPTSVIATSIAGDLQKTMTVYVAH